MTLMPSLRKVRVTPRIAMLFMIKTMLVIALTTDAARIRQRTSHGGGVVGIKVVNEIDGVRAELIVGVVIGCEVNELRVWMLLALLLVLLLLLLLQNCAIPLKLSLW